MVVEGKELTLPVSYEPAWPQPNRIMWHCRVEETGDVLPEWVTREFVVTVTRRNGVLCRSVAPTNADWVSPDGAMLAEYIAAGLVVRQRVLMNQN